MNGDDRERVVERLCAPPEDGRSPRLVGRRTEQERVRRLLDDLINADRADASVPAALVVLGEEGLGKTALLSAAEAAARTRGVAILRGDGAAAEADLAYSVLGQLLRGSTDLLDELPQDQRQALAAAVGLVDAASHPPVPVLSQALHRTLCHLGRHQPVLVVVDDVDRVDRHSLQVLIFVARRIRAGDGIAVLLAGRGAAAPPSDSSLPLLQLEPLDHRAAVDLVDSQPGPPHGRHRWDVIRAAAGHPAAIVELARDEGGGPWLTPSRLTLARIARELDDLPAQTGRLLLYAAAAPDEPLATLHRAADCGPGLSDWTPAEQRGLITVRTAGVSFASPLLRLGRYALATAEARRQVHRDLAYASVDATRSTWHRAHACMGVDDEVASALERMAESRGSHGDTEAAVRALERAAECSADPRETDRRHLVALRAAHLHGDTEWIEQLCSTVVEFTPDPETRSIATVVAASSLVLRGQTRKAFDLLERALVPDGTGAGALPLPVLVSMNGVAARSGLPEHEASLSRRLEDATAASDRAHGQASAYEQYVLALLRFRREPAGSATALARLLQTDHPALGTGPVELLILGALAWQAHDVRTCVELLRRGHAAAPSPGLPAHTVGPYVAALIQHGLWFEADDVIERWFRIAETHRMPAVAVEIACARATLLAWRGRVDDAADVLTRARTLVDLAENLALDVGLRDAAAAVATSRGVPQEAFRALRGAFTPTGAPRHAELSPPLVARLATAARGDDEKADAVSVLRVVRAACGSSPSTRARLVLHHADAALATDREAESHYRMALADPHGEDWPLDRALVRLHYGEWLRRGRRTVESRALLAAAADSFSDLGAAALTERARAELRAAGVGGASEPEHDRIPETGLDELTAQQREIVKLAAAGLRNREIAERLFLSPRTVGSHLHHAYPKLGVSGRHQLRAVLVS